MALKNPACLPAKQAGWQAGCQPRTEESGKPSQQIEVFDIKNNTTTSYDSIHEATRALNLYSQKIISSYIKNNQKKPYKGQYTFKKIYGLVSKRLSSEFSFKDRCSYI